MQFRSHAFPAGFNAAAAQIKTMRVLPAAIMLLLITTLDNCGQPEGGGAVKVLQAVGADASKLKIFCELMDLDEKLGDKQDPVLEAQIAKLLDQLGPDFKVAWDIVEDTDERSPDGRSVSAALDQLEDKCRRLR
jgi:hypothetical protein